MTKRHQNCQERDNGHCKITSLGPQTGRGRGIGMTLVDSPTATDGSVHAKYDSCCIPVILYCTSAHARRSLFAVQALPAKLVASLQLPPNIEMVPRRGGTLGNV